MGRPIIPKNLSLIAWFTFVALAASVAMVVILATTPAYFSDRVDEGGISLTSILRVTTVFVTSMFRTPLDAELALEETAPASSSSLVQRGQGPSRSLDREVSEPSKDVPEVITYTVKEGDTIWAISREYGVDMDTIIWANNLRDSGSLRPGQVLRFPSVSGVIHTILRGETISAIARRYGVSSQAIEEANGIDEPDRIMPDQTLIIPGGKPPEPVRTATAATSRTTTATTAAERRLSAMSFVWPTQGRISSQFGTRWGRMHTGIDIAVPIGTAVRASAPGSVSFAGWSVGYGRLVIIDHGNSVRTYYAHNSKLLVEEGEWVNANDLIAMSGNTGRSTGPHLHFEIRLANEPVNPLRYLPR